MFELLLISVLSQPKFVIEKEPLVVIKGSNNEPLVIIKEMEKPQFITEAKEVPTDLANLIFDSLEETPKRKILLHEPVNPPMQQVCTANGCRLVSSYTPFNLGADWSDLDVEIRKTDGFAQYPAWTIEDLPDKKWYGNLRPSQIRGILKEYPAPYSALTVGSIKGKQQVANLFKLLEEYGPGEVAATITLSKDLKFGTVIVPAKTVVTYKFAPKSMSLKLNPPAYVPYQLLGERRAEIKGLSITEDKITVEIVGFLDLAKRLVD